MLNSDLKRALCGPGTALFAGRGQARLFTAPSGVIVAETADAVRPCLEKVEEALAAGRWAAGYLAYEAASAFDSALAVHAPLDGFPLAVFGLYDHSETVPPDQLVPSRTASWTVGDWKPEVTRGEYDTAIDRIRSLIAAGDTYQINYTFPMLTAFQGDPLEWFLSLCARQETEHRAWLHFGDFKILSLSPELFFRLEGDLLETRPMKGTIARGRWSGEDEQARRTLLDSVKDRAENLMIVDLLRNDMGRISETGSVTVPRLFEAERYETVWQMTSTIQSRTTAGLTDIFAALFPSGSVTGAPKIRAMQIIRDTEPAPRGVYCGAMGWCGPGRRAEFNVAIRTILLHETTGQARYAVGGGITWDSTATGEYDECRLKAAFLNRDTPSFELLESLRWDGEQFFLLREHLDRLAQSAAYFGYPMDADTVLAALQEAVKGWVHRPAKVRLLLHKNGAAQVFAAPAPEPQPVVLRWAAKPVDDTDPFLFHKTTHRRVYDDAFKDCGGADDALLWNARGEVTESCLANVLVKLDGVWYTPPLSCGLLPGTMRRHLLETGRIHEAVIMREVLKKASERALINSVRGWISVTRLLE